MAVRSIFAVTEKMEPWIGQKEMNVRSGSFVMDKANTIQPQPRFARRSDAESVCAFCTATIRADQYRPLEEAEDIHADVCLVRPDSSVRYTIL